MERQRRGRDLGQVDRCQINEAAEAAEFRAVRVRVGSDVDAHCVLEPRWARGHHPDIAGSELICRARDKRMHGGGITGHGSKVLRSRDPTEPELACRLTMPFPETKFPCLEPKNELVIHLGFSLKKGENRWVQERLEARVAAAGSGVSAKEYINRSLAQLLKSGI